MSLRVFVCGYLGTRGTDCDSRTPSFPSWQPACVHEMKRERGVAGKGRARKEQKVRKGKKG